MDKWATGIFTSIDEGLGAGLDSVKELGVSTVHLHAPGRDFRTAEKTAEIKDQFAAAGIEISVVFAGFPDGRLHPRRKSPSKRSGSCL